MSRMVPGRPLAYLPIFTLVLGSVTSAPVVAQGGCEVILDSLAPATPATVFNVAPSGGLTIDRDQFAGPQFTLTRQATLSEVGTFFTDCTTSPSCPGFAVEIWGARGNGAPDPAAVLGSFPLSSDGQFDIISYESARMSLPLAPGTYFAMFVPVEPSKGNLVDSAGSPFPYEPRRIQVGVYHPPTGLTGTLAYPLGARILAGCTVAVRIDLRPGGGPNQVNPRGNGLVPVAVFSAADLDASAIDPQTVRFGAAGTEAAPVRWSLEHVDADGRLDLLLHFRSRDMGLACGARIAVLKGETFDGQPVEGSDLVQVLGCPAWR